MSEIPRLRAEGVPISEFVQLPGEVVYVPEGWVHAVVNLEPSVGVAFEVQHSMPPFAVGWPPHIKEQRHQAQQAQLEREQQQQQQHEQQQQSNGATVAGEEGVRGIPGLKSGLSAQTQTTARSQLMSWPTASELFFMHAGGRGLPGPPNALQVDRVVMDAIDKIRGVVDGPPCYVLVAGCTGATALKSGRSVNVATLLNTTSPDKSGTRQTETLVTMKDAAISRVLTEKQMATHSLLHTKLVGGGMMGWPRVDLNQFPTYARAQGWAYTLNAGDTLYIPAYWWHWVRSDGAPTVAVNVWTNQPHCNIFEPGCSPDADYKCGRVPTLFPAAAAEWPARKKWTLPFIRSQYYRAREDEAALGQQAPELLGTCAASDSIYPEMWGTRVMGVSPWHIRGAPPKPQSFDDFAAVITAQAAGDVCHLHLPLEHMPSSMMDDIWMPRGNRPPATGARNPVSMNLWITGGSLQSGLHFDSHYNSLTVLSGTKTIFLFPPAETKHLYKVGNVASSPSLGSNTPALLQL